jgi:carbon starvation protein
MDALKGMNALTLTFAALCFFAIGYRFYGLFLARKVLKLNKDRSTPAVLYEDGKDYVKSSKTVVFGYHFSAISAAGPLLGPVLAAQYGFLPGALWILIGCVLAGAVHDMVVLFASVRHKAQGFARIATVEIGAFTGHVASLSVLFILILTLAVLSIAVVNAMSDSPWATFTVFATIPIALLMGLLLRFVWPGAVGAISAVGVFLLFMAIIVGRYVDASPSLSEFFTLSRSSLNWYLLIYAFIASVLPIWLLLCPRDYLSAFLKIGTIVGLALSILVVRPPLLMDPVTPFVYGGGPNLPGPLFPFLFITIACGALSGFHAIIGTGTTPKTIASEEDILFVGYGAMLAEGFVAIMALIAACTLIPADYFAITSSAERFAGTGMQTVDLPALSAAVRENLENRPGGAVTLATGMSNIFASFPFMSSLVSYWYHFAIMFEAVFIITAVDAGTRVGRYFLQELLGKIHPKLGRKDWWPSIIFTSLLFTAAWGYLVVTGDIFSVWPLFGLSNQLLAACSLILTTSMLIRMGRIRYAWCTAVPGFFMAFITLWAGYIQVTTIYFPGNQKVLTALGTVIMLLMLIVIVNSIRRWIALLNINHPQTDTYGDRVLYLVEE